MRSHSQSPFFCNTIRGFAGFPAFYLRAVLDAASPVDVVISTAVNGNTYFCDSLGTRPVLSMMRDVLYVVDVVQHGEHKGCVGVYHSLQEARRAARRHSAGLGRIIDNS